MFNKRGQDLSIGTLILIVLGIIVLVLLILGFSIGWGNLWEKINIFGGGNSLGEVISGCNLDVTANNRYGYCQEFHKLKIDGKIDYVNCQDSRVSGAVDSKLDCSSIPAYANEAFSASSYCATLGNVEKTKVLVNGQFCTTWTSQTGAKSCQGTPTVCSTLTKGDCPNQLGCSLANNVCTGTATACTGLSETQCGTLTTGQRGCEWK